MARGHDLLDRSEVIETLTGLAGEVGGGGGRAVAVVAAAGLGKTAVLSAVEAALADMPFVVCSAAGGEHEQSLPHGVTRSLLEPALADPALRAQVMVEAAAPASVLFSSGGVHSEGQLHHALYWTVANLARVRPLALVVDDAHWADEASLETLLYLARRLADLPVLLVVATRPETQAAWLAPLRALADLAQLTSLDPLSARAVDSFVTRELGQDVAPEFAAACRRATGGNPFYLVELMRDVSRRGLEASTTNAALIETLAPPAIVHSVLLGLATLAPGSLALARACAVLSDGSTLRDAAALADLEPQVAARAADALTDAGVFQAGAALGFTHPILRAAVLDDFGRHELRQWHRRAATVLATTGAGSAVLATHLLHTEPARDEWVATTLLDAARSAMASGSPATALQLLRRALLEPPAEADVADHLFEIAVAEAHLGDPEALVHFPLAVAATADPDVLVMRSLHFAAFARQAHQAVLAVDAIDEATALLAQRGATPSPPVALAAAVARYWIGRTSTQTIDRVRGDVGILDEARQLPDCSLRREALVYRGMEAAIAEDRDTAVRLLNESDAPPGLLHFVPPESIAPYMAMVSSTGLEEHQLQAQLARAVLERAGRTGNVVGSLQATFCNVLDLVRRGVLLEAEEEIDRVMASPDLALWASGTPDWVAMQVQVHVQRGDIDRAAEALTTLRHPVDPPTSPPEAMVLMARARLHLARNDLGGARLDLVAVGACEDELGEASPGLVAWRSALAQVLVLSGEREEARRLAECEVAYARTRCGPRVLANALRVLASTVQGQEQLNLLEEALSKAEKSRGPLVRAEVHIDLGTLLRRRGHAAAARTHLAAGLDLADRCGAVPLAAHAHDELHASGARPRRTRISGPDALTHAERRVARLAADGMTNTVIAQTLFVSRKTVEKHLANAYAKLDITSRAGLDGIDLGHSVPTTRR